MLHSQIITHPFFIPQLNRHRTIRVLLPKTYTQYPERRFPVIYLHDGQNLFDARTAAFRPWKLRERMDKQPLYRQAVLVGIDHGGIDRTHEYAPFHRGRIGGQGDQLIQFITHTLKPFIDQQYRTWPHREATGMAGSSMGGLLTLYAALQYGHVFGKAGVFSPSLWFNPKITDMIRPDVPIAKIYMAGSKTESAYMSRNMENMYWKFRKAGYSDDDFRVVLRDRGRHNEVFWGKEFKPMYEWLFEKTI